ncbi:hypothetical protein ACFYNW_37935 [Streptomyces virginiae]|uniref:hypothetical protein n=1 Tax=Streptomyces virginiae TaxID=1961 RepID=UPI0036E32D18
MTLIAEHTILAHPARGLVEVYDSDAFTGDDDALQRSRAQVVAGNPYHLYLHSLQPEIQVHITIRLWEGPQQPSIDSEGAIALSLESETGVLVVNQLDYGPAGDVNLPRPGVYEGYAAWTGREATAAYHRATMQRAAAEGWDGEQIASAWTQCPATENYTLNLWFVREPEPEEED